jgi:ElaB/YqjD/DUF883 family membrane-anchored ribosome-binding protein
MVKENKMAQAMNENHARTKRNGSARSALKSSANDVLEDFEELRKDVAKLADAAKKAARSEVKHAGAHIGEIGRGLRGRAEERVSYVSEQVRERPAAAVGVSLGVGLLLGLLLSRR